MTETRPREVSELPPTHSGLSIPQKPSSPISPCAGAIPPVDRDGGHARGTMEAVHTLPPYTHTTQAPPSSIFPPPHTTPPCAKVPVTTGRDPRHPRPAPIKDHLYSQSVPGTERPGLPLSLALAHSVDPTSQRRMQAPPSTASPLSRVNNSALPWQF